jgi:hypothetical protein
MEGQSSGGFKVVDRRRFTAEGEVKPGAPADPPVVVASVSSAQAAHDAPKTVSAAAAEQRPAPVASQAFMSLVASLAQSAVSALRMLVEQGPRSGVEPSMVKEYIDILAMLQDKTKGNLTKEEDLALHRILNDLRMRYLELTQKPRPSSL